MAEQQQSAVDFRLGVELIVERKMGGQKQRGRCQLVGAVKDRFLILSMPLIDGVPAFTIPNDPCIVRYVDQGRVVGFTSTVVKVLFDPAALVFIDYPKKPEVITLRQSQRLKTDLPAVVHRTGQEEQIVRARIVDLSAGGCRVTTLGTFSVGAPLFMSFKMPSGREYQKIEATVVKVVAGAKPDAPINIGASFVDPPPELVAEIENIANIIDAPPA